jgi:pheromone shutdown-related protein TraB
MKRESLTIIGTAHVSKESVEEVKDAIYTQKPEVVAIELDDGRYKRLMDERDGVEEHISVTKIIKEDKVGVFIASAVLTIIQSKIGAKLEVKPGSEMIAAVDAGCEVDSQIICIDRDINITLQRVMNKMSFFEKVKFIFSTIYSLFDDEEEDMDIEDLKNQDTLDEVMEYFKETSPSVYEVLVHERDAYLAKSILEIKNDHIIAVVGAGHKTGITQYLDHPDEIPSIEELTDVENKGLPWVKIILGAIPVSFILIFIVAYFKGGIDIGYNIFEFILIGGGCSFIGSILSGSKIQSALVAFVAAPLTIIHPLLAAGWFSGLTEAKYRKFKQSDIANLTKIDSFKDIWKNSIFRILFVVVGTNIGATIATLFILPSIVFIPMLHQIFVG